MKLDLRPLLSGEKKELAFSFTLVPDVVEDPMSSLYRVTFPSPLSCNGTVVNNAGYMRMSLCVSAGYTAFCSRCLTPVSGEFSYHLEKTVVPSGMLSNISEDEADDYAIIHDGFLDMDDELLELLELEFPQKLLCREDCKGLCPHCGADLNHEACTCKNDDIDPRMAPLRALYEKLRAEEEAEKNENKN